MAFGAALRKAREAKGLSTSEVAAATRMMVQIVEDLEREEFGRIAAVIYGKGFIKLYAELVGLDPKPLLADYVEMAGPAGPKLGQEPVDPERPTVRRVSADGTAGKASAKPPGKASAGEGEAPPAAEPEPDLFSAPARSTASPPVRTPPRQAAQRAPGKRVKPAPGLLQLAAGLWRSLAKGVSRGWKRLERTVGALRKRLMERIESIRFDEAPLRTIAIAIGLVLVVLLLLSALSRLLRRPDPDAPYPIAIEIPEPYFD